MHTGGFQIKMIEVNYREILEEILTVHTAGR